MSSDNSQQNEPSQEQTLAKAAYCTEPHHFYAPHARDLIGRLLRNFLDSLRITPTELLHSVAYQRKLMMAGNVLEGAVQKACLAQVKDTPTSVTVRIKEMHALVESVTKRVRAQEQGYGIEKMDADECLQALTKSAAEPDSNAKDFKMNRLATRYMESSDGWSDKFARLFNIFKQLSSGAAAKNPRNVAFGDTILGEIIRSKAGLDMVIGDFASLEERLNDIAALYRGDYEPNEGVADIETSRKIAALFHDHKLTSSRAGLAYHVYSALTGRTNVLSRDVVVELAAIARLIDALKVETGFIGGVKTYDLLERRISRTLSVENLGEKLRQLPNKVDQVRTLVKVHDILVGQANKRLVRNYVDYVMEDREFGAKLLSGDADRGELVGRPGDLYKIFSESDLADIQKNKYSALSERLQDEFIKSTNFFRSLDQESKDPSKKALLLMQLCSRGGFIEGPHLEAARKLIAHYIMQPQFLPQYLADAKTNEARNQKIDDLKRYLLDAGIDQDLAGAQS